MKLLRMFGMISLMTYKLRRRGYKLVRMPAVYPEGMPLTKEHIKNCKLIENRIGLLDRMPKKSICAEVGVKDGDFSEKILSIVKPDRLHLIDSCYDNIEHAKDRFSSKIDSQVFLHRGDSFGEIIKFDDNYFDWIYIDANHTYDLVKRDMEASRMKVKDNGLIVLNDYIFYDHIMGDKYGVVEAVNEFCNKHDYEIVYFALEPQMFNDVAVRRIRR